MNEIFTKRIIEKLSLSFNDKANDISSFLDTVSYYKLTPYIDFVKAHKELKDCFTNCKDAWDIVIEIYRYNTKLSIAIYPYIFVLETVLKNKINNALFKYYGENWYKDEEFFFNIHGFDDTDKQLYEKFYLFKELESDQLEEIKSTYKAKKPDISNKEIKKKVGKLKSCLYLLTETRLFLSKLDSKNNTLMDFVEKKTTMGYWLKLLEVKNYLWEGQKISEKEVKLKILFTNGEYNLEELGHDKIYSQIIMLIDSIRILRNKISHYNQIIGCNIYEKGYITYRLWDVYQNILKCFKLLGIQSIEDLIGDLVCNGNIDFQCEGHSFENIYKKYDFIHLYSIKADPSI